MVDEKGLRFVLDEATRSVRACYAPGDEEENIGPESIAEALAKHGWDAAVLDQREMAQFLDACRRAEEPIQAVVGEVRDGALSLEITHDRMNALLTIEAPRGGLPVTAQQVRDMLVQRNVAFGIDETQVEAAVAARACRDAVVARGLSPVQGRATRFESLLDALRRQPEPEADDADDASALVDYRTLGDLLLVAPGTPLMRRVPAVQGIEGRDVLGNAIAPATLIDIPFPPGLSGSEPSADDPCLLVATVAGVPMPQAQGVNVNPLVEVDAVDLSTGNISFEGTLKVKGDIKTGMSVHVGGDVVVQGTIEAATVEAGGSVIVTGGIIGAPESTVTNPADGAAKTARIICGGSVQARFIDNAVISAGVNVAVKGEIRQSDVAAGQSIESGPPGSQQGVIAGGRCRALLLVRAGTIGSPAGVPTEVHVGVNPHAATRKAAIEQERHAVNEELGKLEKLLTFFQANPEKGEGGVADRVRNTMAAMVGKLQTLEADETALAAELSLTYSAVIHATRRFCGGTDLVVGVKRMQIIETTGVGGKAVLEEDEVVLR